MKLRFLLAVLFASSFLYSQSFHTITIDGNNDFTTSAERCVTTSPTSSYAYVTWDKNYLYFGFSGNSPQGKITDGGRVYHIYLDTDPQPNPKTGNGSSSGEVWRWAPSLPFNADYHYAFKTVNNEETKRGYASSWDNSSINSANWKGDGFWEVRFSLSSLGSPKQINLIAYIEEDWDGGSISGGLPSNLFTNTSTSGTISFNDHWVNNYLIEQVAPNAVYNLDNFQWLVRLTASTVSLSDTNIFAGMGTNATDGYDIGIDIAKPPAPSSNYIDLYFNQTDWTTSVFGPPHSRNIKKRVSLDSTTTSWDFKVRTDQTNQSVTLNAKDYDFVPSNYEIEIKDVTLDSTHNIRTGGSYQYNSGVSTSRDFKLIIGVTLTPPNISADQNTLPFGVVLLGNNNSLNLTVQNTGQEPLSITSIVSSNSVFTFTGGTSYSIASNATVIVPVTFTPTSGIAYSETLTIASNDPDTPNKVVQLTGTGLTPTSQISLSPSTLQFGSVKVDYDSTLSFKIKNLGTGQLTVASIISTGSNFSLSGSQAFTVAVGDSTTRSVVFKPTVTTTYSDTLKIASNDPVNPIYKMILTGTGTTAAFSKNYPTGWSLVSFPVKPENQYKGAVIGDDVSSYLFYGYNSSGGYFSEDSIKTGQGYWLGLYSNDTVDVTGTAVVDSALLQLNGGWNISASPFVKAYSTSKVYFKKGTRILPASSAADSGWISNNFYKYDNSTSSYSASSSLDQWYGYWLSALRDDVSIIFYHDSTTGTALKQITPDAIKSVDNWFVNIKAKHGNFEDKLMSFGASLDAVDGFDYKLDQTKPPMSPASGAVEVYFEYPDWNKFIKKFSSDIKSKYEYPEPGKSWNFNVRTNSSGTVSLSWDNIASELPSEIKNNYNFKLSGYGITGTLDMLISNQFNFNAAEDVVYSFAINSIVTDIDDPSLIHDFNLNQNYPNPFNPTTVIEYSIKNDGLVNLTVYDILGKTVAHAVNNFQKAGTYKVNFDAADLASGIYFYEIRSGGFYDVKKMILIR
ncbi:MAG: choice-of-anchor D domain-containing protein [Bacteroidota bacterium]